jgi:hypothetical protein
MNVRAICSGGFTLPMTVAEALPLFTPEGERSWAGADWVPVYALPESAQDDSAPGTVFSTMSHGGAAIWVVVERRPDGMRYARVAPGHIAGTIDVTCTPLDDGTDVRVVYDVTSLGPEGIDFVRELESGYDAFMSSWREEILAGVALPNHQSTPEGPHAAVRDPAS